MGSKLNTGLLGKLIHGSSIPNSQLLWWIFSNMRVCSLFFDLTKIIWFDTFWNTINHILHVTSICFVRSGYWRANGKLTRNHYFLYSIYRYWILTSSSSIKKDKHLSLTTDTTAFLYMALAWVINDTTTKYALNVFSFSCRSTFVVVVSLYPLASHLCSVELWSSLQPMLS